MTARRRNDRGLTLIELVAAMAIFALIAVMGLQALTGALRSRDRMVALDTRTAELAVTISLLRADLSALVPLLFQPGDGPPRSALDLDRQARVLGLSLAGQPALPPQPGPGLRRVEWRFDPGAGTLSRRVWPALYPAGGAVPAPDVTVLTFLDGWSLRSYWQGEGWVAGVASGQPPSAPELAGSDGDSAFEAVPERYSSTLPLAVELTLDTAHHGKIVLVESLK